MSDKRNLRRITKWARVRLACALMSGTSRCPLVNTAVCIPRASDDSTPTTLGDVLVVDLSRPSERQWVAVVRAIASGEQAALRELYGRMHVLVFTVVFRIVQNRCAAEELTLDVFHDVWRRAGTYHESGGTVIGWIMNQARSRAIDRVRFDQRKKRVPALDEGDEPSTARSAEDGADADQRGQVVRDALKHLTAEERKAIEIAYFAGRTYAEVAEQLEELPGTIKSRIRSGLIKLRHRLAHEERFQ